MTRTEHYQLPQWAANDPVRREDFNQAMESVDTGITAAQKAADAARGAANAAQQTATAALNATPYVAGTYTGTGEVLSITLGFRPRFVVVSGQKETYATNYTDDFDSFFGMTAGNIMTHRLAFTDTGFTVYPGSSAYYYRPDFNETGRVYDYIAFK